LRKFEISLEFPLQTLGVFESPFLKSMIFPVVLVSHPPIFLFSELIFDRFKAALFSDRVQVRMAVSLFFPFFLPVWILLEVFFTLR